MRNVEDVNYIISMIEQSINNANDKISKINNSKIISDIVATILYMVEPGAINDKDQSSEEF